MFQDGFSSLLSSALIECILRVNEHSVVIRSRNEGVVHQSDELVHLLPTMMSTTRILAKNAGRLEEAFDVNALMESVHNNH